MAVRLRSDRHPLFGPGFALLMFDRPVDTPRLDISILNTVTGLYLGPSAPGRPNWVKQQTTFFPAIRAGGQGSSIFRVGPEVTTYIQEGTYVEIASADGSVREELSWEGVLLRSSPAGTEDWTNRAEAFESDLDGSSVDAGQPRTDVLEKARRDEQEAIRRKRQEEDRLRAEQAAAATALARQQAEEHARRRTAEAAAAQRTQEEVIRRKHQEEEERLRAELASAAAAQARQQAEEDARRRAEEAAAAQRAQEEAIRREQQEERARTEQAAEAAALARQQAAEEARRQAEEAAAIQRTNEAERTVPPTSARASDELGARGEVQAPLESLEQDSKRPGMRSILALATLVAAAIAGPILIFAALAAVVLGLQEISNPGHLCWRFEVFCSPKAETTAPTQSAAAPPTEIAPPPIAPAPVAPIPAAEQPSNDNCATKAMGTYSRPTNDRILAYIRAHEEKRNFPDSDLDGIARYHCFADKDDYTRSYFAIAAASARRDKSLYLDILIEFDAEIGRTIKPSDDPTLLPSNAQQPPTADSLRPPAGGPRRRR